MTGSTLIVIGLCAGILTVIVKEVIKAKKENMETPDYLRQDKLELIFMEDDALVSDPDSEKVANAFKRLTGKDLNTEEAIESKDYGDAEYYNMGNGWVVCGSYPGNSAIYRIKGQIF